MSSSCRARLALLLSLTLAAPLRAGGPSPPGSVSVVTCPGGGCGNCARVSWSAPAEYDAFRVERAPDQGTFEPPPESAWCAVALAVPAFSYDDLAPPGSLVWYRVRTVLDGAASAPSQAQPYFTSNVAPCTASPCLSLFAHGFEAGSTAGWSAVVGGS